MYRSTKKSEKWLVKALVHLFFMVQTIHIESISTILVYDNEKQAFSVKDTSPMEMIH